MAFFKYDLHYNGVVNILKILLHCINIIEFNVITFHLLYWRYNPARALVFSMVS
jgi:hypothetical protein